jgi:hypothetical protein
MRNEMRQVIARLLSKHAELADVSRKAIDTMDNYLELLPMV